MAVVELGQVEEALHERQVRERRDELVDVRLLEDERRQQPHDVRIVGAAGEDPALAQRREDAAAPGTFVRSPSR